MALDLVQRRSLAPAELKFLLARELAEVHAAHISLLINITWFKTSDICIICSCPVNGLISALTTRIEKCPPPVQRVLQFHLPV